MSKSDFDDFESDFDCGCEEDERDEEQRDEDGRLNKPLEQYSTYEIEEEGLRLAESYLEKRKFEILEKDWMCGCGACDFVAKRKDEKQTVLVHVDTKLALDEEEYIMPELNIDGKKQKQFRALCLMYMAQNAKCHSVRYDVIALNIVGERMAKLRHLVSAYDIDEDC